MALVADVSSSVMNSYVTAQEALAYFSDRGHSEDWDDVENQSSFLIGATNQIDWFMDFKGSKVESSQPLEWPRQDVFVDGEYVSITEIPTRVKQAVLELALASIDEDRVADSDMAGLQEVKVGTLKVVANAVGSWQTKKGPIPDVVYAILGKFINNSSGMFRRTVRT